MVSQAIDSSMIKKLSCVVQNYDWGLLGKESLAGKIFQLNTGRALQSDKPYAEVNDQNLDCLIHR
jgi:mannose-6-phosphate isomerase class I